MSMTFQPNKTLKELNIDTSRKFVVVDGGHCSFKKGDMLEWISGSDKAPLFKRISDGCRCFCFLSRLGYYHDTITWDTLEIGDEVKNKGGGSQWVLDIHGRVIDLSACNDKNTHGWSATKEELIKDGFTIVQPEPQKDPEVEKAIKFLEDKGIIKEGKIIS